MFCPFLFKIENVFAIMLPCQLISSLFRPILRVLTLSLPNPYLIQISSHFPGQSPLFQGPRCPQILKRKSSYCRHNYYRKEPPNSSAPNTSTAIRDQLKHNLPTINPEHSEKTFLTPPHMSIPNPRP